MLIGVSVRTSTPAKGQTLQAAGSLKWYRGNLHTHSLWSDGDDYLESIALWLSMAREADAPVHRQRESVDVLGRDGIALRFQVPQVELGAEHLRGLDMEI